MHKWTLSSAACLNMTESNKVTLKVHTFSTHWSCSCTMYVLQHEVRTQLRHTTPSHHCAVTLLLIQTLQIIVPAIYCLCSLTGSVNVTDRPLRKRILMSRLARKACWFAYWQMQLDAVEHPDSLFGYVAALEPLAFFPFLSFPLQMQSSNFLE